METIKEAAMNLAENHPKQAIDVAEKDYIFADALAQYLFSILKEERDANVLETKTKM